MQMDPAFLETCHRWLLFYHHCTSCERGDCAYPCCSYGKSIFTHVKGCCRSHCTYPRCRLVKNILRHHQSCKVTRDCEVCTPVRTYLARPKGRSEAPSPPPLDQQGAPQPGPEWSAPPPQAQPDQHQCLLRACFHRWSSINGEDPSSDPWISPPPPLAAPAAAFLPMLGPPPPSQLPAAPVLQQEQQPRQQLVTPGLFEARQRSHASALDSSSDTCFKRSSLTPSDGTAPISTAACSGGGSGNSSGSPLHGETSAGSAAALPGLQALHLDHRISSQLPVPTPSPPPPPAQQGQPRAAAHLPFMQAGSAGVLLPPPHHLAGVAFQGGCFLQHGGQLLFAHPGAYAHAAAAAAGAAQHSSQQQQPSAAAAAATAPPHQQQQPQAAQHPHPQTVPAQALLTCSSKAPTMHITQSFGSQPFAPALLNGPHTAVLPSLPSPFTPVQLPPGLIVTPGGFLGVYPQPPLIPQQDQK